MAANGTAKVNVLIVEPDDMLGQNLSQLLREEGYEAAIAPTQAAALSFLDSGAYRLLVCDEALAGRDGMELLRQAKARQPQLQAIVISRYGKICSAVEAMQSGASDYLVAPIEAAPFLSVVRQTIGTAAVSSSTSAPAVFDGIVGGDERILNVFKLITLVADGKTTALITGESGTGKSLIARAIHSHSPRAAGPFVEVSCGALTETLLESELFGHVRGAFTHAVSAREGKFAAADGGTIFLDEISSASPQLQTKLLRVLQERQFEPVGSNETREVDVRVILATNHDLGQLVREGKFRSDLYYRINVVNIELPPLRQRVGDIPLLAKHFLRRFLSESKRPIMGFSPEAMQAMERYSWPGNVRELENCVERATVLCRNVWIGLGDLPQAVVAGTAQTPSSTARGTLEQALAVPEREIILQTLRLHGGSRQETSRQLGIDRTTLYKKMKKFGLLGQI